MLALQHPDRSRRRGEKAALCGGIGRKHGLLALVPDKGFADKGLQKVAIASWNYRDRGMRKRYREKYLPYVG